MFAARFYRLCIPNISLKCFKGNDASSQSWGVIKPRSQPSSELRYLRRPDQMQLWFHS